MSRGGCSHAEGVAKEEFPSAKDVGEGSSSLRKSVRNFISSFWIRFGRAQAKKMAEARHADVFLIWVFFCILFCCFAMYLKFAVLQEIAKKAAKVDKPGPSRPPSEARPSTQAEAEVRDAGAKVPEESGAKASPQAETSAPPPPQV